MGETELVEALRKMNRPVDPSRDERDRIWRRVNLEITKGSSSIDAENVLTTRTVGETIGKGLGRMATAAVAVLLLGLGAVWLGGGEGLVGGGGPETDQTVGAVVQLPQSHPAAGLIARGVPDAATFADLARQEGLTFQCLASDMAQICLVYADGLLAVLPLVAGPGFTMTLSGNVVDQEVAVPLDEGGLAIPGPGGRFTAVIEDAGGQQVASMGGAFFPEPQSSGREIRVPVVSEAEGDASYAVGVTDTGNLCAEARGATEWVGACDGKDLAAVAFQVGDRIVLAGYVPAPVGTLTAILDDGRRILLEPKSVPGNDMLAFGLIERATPAFVGIEVRNQDREVIKTHFPSLGSEGE